MQIRLNIVGRQPNKPWTEKVLENDEFIMVVKNAPLVSLDLVIRSGDNKLLMGKRVNEPAAGSWFVPGGRIRKDESIEDAFLWVTKAELGKPYSIDHAPLLGVFTHKYQTNFAHMPGIGTHYVVLAYELQIDVDPKQLPLEQHSEYRWMGEIDLAIVHPNTEAYFGCLSIMEDNQYSAINARRDLFNNLLWQTPVLSLVAQAFLFTIILGKDSSMAAVTISSVLAIVTAVALRHLLDKHRYGEEQYARWLHADERLRVFMRPIVGYSLAVGG